MRPRSWPGAAPDPSPPRGGAAAVAAPGPGNAGTLAQRLAAVEAGILQDRHRQPATVVEAIARLWSAGATISEIAAEIGVSPHIVRDRLCRAGVLGFVFRDRHRHAREVLERDGARMIEAYVAGATMVVLADGAGVSPHTIRAYLVSRGVMLRHDHGWHRKRSGHRTGRGHGR